MVGLIVTSLPVSISLGVWSTLIIYLVCIPLGIRKAVKNGSRFDLWTSTVILVASAIPQLLFAVLLIILFAGGSYLQWFPLRGLVSNNFSSLSFFGKIGDYLWHMALPVTAEVIGGIRRPDDAHQELLPRRGEQAVRHDRAGQGSHGDGASSASTSSATPCSW